MEPASDFGPLPPLPTEPPPLPEGATEGFDDLPEGATRAADLDLDDVDLTPSEVPVDPVTGKAADIPEVIRTGKDPALARELELAEELRQAKAERDEAVAALTELRESTPMDLEGANSLGGLGPVGQVDPAEHRAAQARYRAVRQQQLMAGNPVEEPEPAPAIELESPEERAERVRVEAREEYERRVAEMDPSEPIYLVGPRPPRPKVAGHTLAIGDIVPGAAYFPRLESWVSTGILVKKEH